MTAFGRRAFGAGVAAAAAAPRAARADSAPIRIGLLTTLTGPLASGGIQMQQGLALYLKARGDRLAGRPVEVFTADTAASPAPTRTKAEELIERNKVDVLIGPLSANEALAIDGTIRAKRIPVVAVAAAEDMTQRLANPWFVRATSTSAQCSYPMADYAWRDLGYRRMATLGEDGLGGRTVQTLFSPLSAIDYATYIAQIKTNIDAIYVALAGSNGFRFFRQTEEYGFGDKVKLLGGMTMVDESNLENMGPGTIGLISTCWYSAQLDTPANVAFVDAMRREYKATPGFYAAASNTCAAVLDHGLQAVDGRVEDKDALMHALRTAVIPDTVRGPVRFDDRGNVIGNVYIRRVERRNGALVNAIIKTYPDVGQFWNWDPAEFLSHPVYSRDEPRAQFIE